MTVSIEAPSMGESISEATVASWAKQEGDFVQQDELIAELETDKVNLEVVAPSAGRLTKIAAGEGDTVTVGQLMGEIDESAAEGAAPSLPAGTPEPEEVEVAEAPAPAPVAPAAVTTVAASVDIPLSPAVRRLVEDNGLNPSQIQGTGKDGRLTKGDVLAFIENPTPKAAPTPVEIPASTAAAPAQAPAASGGEFPERREKMTRLRQTISGRLKTAQNTAAMLTTYNEVDLSEVMAIRSQYKDAFEKKHGVKLGFMSFFTKAVVEALKEFPAVNAEIDGDEIVYKDYVNMGIAVSTPKGLVVPVLKRADQMSLADIEGSIREYGVKGRDGKLTPDDMVGGSFTITNGGVFGSMMSMPILNYPQSAILGMHAIKERPVVVDGEIVIRPMMYLALTYDHRIVDGREAVSTLVKVKEALEDPARMLLEI